MCVFAGLRGTGCVAVLAGPAAAEAAPQRGSSERKCLCAGLEQGVSAHCSLLAAARL